MLIDSNLIFCENKAVGTGTVLADPISLSALKKPGQSEPIPVRIFVTETFEGGTSVAVKFQECNTMNGVYTDVPGFSASFPVADLKKGTVLPIRFLPAGVTKPCLRVVFTASGTFTAGKITALLAREDVIEE